MSLNKYCVNLHVNVITEKKYINLIFARVSLQFVPLNFDCCSGKNISWHHPHVFVTESDKSVALPSNHKRAIWVHAFELNDFPHPRWSRAIKCLLRQRQTYVYVRVGKIRTQLDPIKSQTCEGSLSGGSIETIEEDACFV